MCVFTGRPFFGSSAEEIDSRSREMKRGQEEVEKVGGVSTSPRAAAKKLPIAKSRYGFLSGGCLRVGGWGEGGKGGRFGLLLD